MNVAVCSGVAVVNKDLQLLKYNENLLFTVYFPVCVSSNEYFHKGFIFL